jgi:hypothetical protein
MDLIEALGYSAIAGTVVTLASEIADVDVESLIASLQAGAVKIGSDTPIASDRLRQVFATIKHLSTL